MSSQIRNKGKSGFGGWVASVNRWVASVNRRAILTLISAMVASGINWWTNFSSSPPPLAVLTCMTAGLPDLTVVCDAQGFDFNNGRVNFGDGRPEMKFQGAKASDETAKASDETAKAVSSKRFFWRYRNPGQYRVNLVVTGKAGSGSAWQEVEVSRSDRLKKSIDVKKLAIKGRISSDIVKAKKEFDVARKLSAHRIFGDSWKSYSIVFQADPEWVFDVDGCTFRKTSSRFADYEYLKSTSPEKKDHVIVLADEDEDRVTFEFELESSSFFRGSEDGWLYGTLECTQIASMSGTIESESEKPFSIERYGIHEVNLKRNEAENPVLFKEDAEVEWQMSESRKKLGDIVRIGEDNISLVDIPIIPREERRFNAYLKIEPQDH